MKQQNAQHLDQALNYFYDDLVPTIAVLDFFQLRTAKSHDASDC